MDKFLYLYKVAYTISTIWYPMMALNTESDTRHIGLSLLLEISGLGRFNG
jgi:hypothetical protein